MNQYDGGQTQHAADRQRHQHDDDGQRQHDVLVNNPAASTGVLQRLRDQPEVVAGEGDVSGLDCGVRAGRSHCYAHRRARQRRSVVDAVANHRRRRLGGELGDDACLVLRAQLSAHIVDSGDFSQSPGGASVVAG